MNSITTLLLLEGCCRYRSHGISCLPACHPRDRQRTPYRSAEDAVRCLVSDRRRIFWVTYPSQPPPLKPPPPPCRLQFTVDFIRSTRVTRAPPTQKSGGGGGSLCDLSRAQVRPPSDPISLNPGCLSSLGEWGESVPGGAVDGGPSKSRTN